jgi:hypothetical protein
MMPSALPRMTEVAESALEQLRRANLIAATDPAKLAQALGNLEHLAGADPRNPTEAAALGNLAAWVAETRAAM